MNESWAAGLYSLSPVGIGEAARAWLASCMHGRAERQRDAPAMLCSHSWHLGMRWVVWLDLDVDVYSYLLTIQGARSRRGGCLVGRTLVPSCRVMLMDALYVSARMGEIFKSEF